MISQFSRIAGKQQLRAALDWTVFTIGALSLSTAIAATILIHS